MTVNNIQNFDDRQLEFIKNSLSEMSLSQQSHIYSFLGSLLQRDFIAYLPYHVVEKILGYLDAKSLRSAELVSVDWYDVVSEGKLWKKLIDRRIYLDPVWRGIWERYPWDTSPPSYGSLYAKMEQRVENVEANWRRGRYKLKSIDCGGRYMICCMQYDRDRIVVGLSSNAIKIFNRRTLELENELNGHTGSVICLQYDDRFIISGSSDSTVRVWGFDDGKLQNVLAHHLDSVLQLRFRNDTLMTCSKDNTVAVWNIVSPAEIVLSNVVMCSGVNSIDFDDRYMVSGSSDGTIKVWNAAAAVDEPAYEFVRRLRGHRHRITCLQYTYPLIASGSFDKTVKLWNVDSGACLRVLEGHRNEIGCLKFDGERIISGSYDKTIKIWALDLQKSICLHTLGEHYKKITALGFDDFEIISCSQDGFVLIWDFWSH